MAPELVDGNAPLLRAAQTGRLAEVQRLLNEGTNPDIHSENGWTPLHAASWNRHPEVVKLLIQHHASLEPKFRKRTPLHKAAQRGYVEVAQALINGGADIEAGAPGYKRPLGVAAENGHDVFVKLLLEHNADTNAQDAEGWTALHSASYNGHPAVVKLLIQNGANVEARFKTSRTPLHKAAERGNVDAVQALLEGNADIDALSTDNWTPLYIAAKEGHYAVANLLLERGAKVDSRSVDGSTALNTAVQNGHKAIVDLLLQKGAPLEAKVDNDFFTALHQAAAAGFADIIGLLLDAKANIEARSGDDSTPIHLAATHGNAKAVKLLLERHANHKAKNKAQKTPLALANDNHHNQVSALLSAVDQSDDSGLSDLLSAASMNIKTSDSANFLASGKNGPDAWLRKIDEYNAFIQEAAKKNKGLSPVRIAVLDTGCSEDAIYFRQNQDELSRIKGDHWHDFVESKNSPVDVDKNQHGTMVSVLLLRVAKNAELFVARIARTNLELRGAAPNIVKAIQYAQDPQGWNVDMVCMSFGFRQEIQSISKAIQKAEIERNSSIVFFAAAANSGSNETEMFPAYLSQVISVRGTDNLGTFVGAYDPPPISTNEGQALFGTLGENVPYVSGQTSSGCSVATPIMVGMVAMVWQWASYKMDLGARQKLRTSRGVRQLLKSIGVKKGENRYYVHVWDLFNNNGVNFKVRVEGAMAPLPELSV